MKKTSKPRIKYNRASNLWMCTTNHKTLPFNIGYGFTVADAYANYIKSNYY